MFTNKGIPLELDMYQLTGVQKMEFNLYLGHKIFFNESCQLFEVLYAGVPHRFIDEIAAREFIREVFG